MTPDSHLDRRNNQNMNYLPGEGFQCLFVNNGW